METLLKEIKDYCVANYDNGYDVYVECYTDEELKEEFLICSDFLYYKPVKDLQGFIDRTKGSREHREDIQATAF